MPLRMKSRPTTAGENAAADDKQMGLQALQEKRWLEAASHLKKALQSSPTDIDVMNALALAQDGLGDGKAARSTLGKAIALAPDHAKTHHNLAVLLAREGRALEAAEAACRAVDLDPSDAESFRLLKQIRELVRTTRPPAKRRSRKRSQSHGPTQQDIDSRLRQINLALARAKSASTAETEVALQQAKGLLETTVRPSISLCMIVRDEEAFLGDCLRSVAGLADEIVVVDTGSKDRTSEVAKAYNASVYLHEWTDSFADARNKALEHATGDWILVLDADERLDPDSRAVILQTVTKPKADAYELLIRNYRSAGPNPDIYSHRACRLYRRSPAYRYRGRVHELIVPSITASGGRVGRLDAVIHHHGYRTEMMEERRKHERYIRLLEADLEEDPQSIHCLYNLGTAYWSSGDAERALAYLQQAAQLVYAGHEYAPAIFCAVVNVLCRTGRPEQALAAADRAEKMGVRHPEINFSRGNALLLLKQYQPAIAQFQMAIRAGRSGDWTGDAGAVGYKADFGIASAYFGLGDYVRTVESCRRVVAEKPDDAEAHELLARAYLHLKRLDSAEKHCLQAVRLKRDYAQAHASLARIYGAQGRIGEALQSFVRTLEIDPTYTDVYFEAADLLRSMGRYQDAANVYQNGLSCNPRNAPGFFALGNCYFQMGAYEAAKVAYRQALTIRPDYRDAAESLARTEQALSEKRAA